MSVDEDKKAKRTHVIAHEVADQVRAYVRDRFVPGSLDSLGDLHHFAYDVVSHALERERGQFTCRTCGEGVLVERVRCSTCAGTVVSIKAETDGSKESLMAIEDIIDAAVRRVRGIEQKETTER